MLLRVHAVSSRYVWTLAAAMFVAIVTASSIDIVRATGGIKGDEATYVAMAASFAHDGDFEFDEEDYQRFRAWYGSGPEGIFLKREADGSLSFGKAYLYGLVAAPFARFGPRGLLLFNLTCLLITVAAGAWWLAGRGRRAPAVVYSFLFAFASATPIYSLWLTSDVLNYALVFLAFAIGWPRGENEQRSERAIAVAMLLLAAATFSKPLNAPLAAALALPRGPRTITTVALRLAIFGGAVALFFTINLAATGDFNYQGGRERKTFYGRFPFDEHGTSYDTSGIDMVTNTLQTPVGEEGRLITLPYNAWYFITGRHFGMIPFGWPWLLSAWLWLVWQRRRSLGEFALAAAVAAVAFVTIFWMPYTWSGGGGPIGNRYFLGQGAALFFLTPPLTSWAAPAIAAFGLLFVAPLYRAPFDMVKEPWRATHPPQFRVLPLEITGASDFPIILSPRLGRVPQGRDPIVYAAFLDENAGFGTDGWIAIDSNSDAELLVRSPEPLQRVIVGVRATGGCEVILDDGGGETAVSLGSGDRQDVPLTPRLTFSREAFVFVLTVHATQCPPGLEIALQGRRP